MLATYYRPYSFTEDSRSRKLRIEEIILKPMVIFHSKISFNLPLSQPSLILLSLITTLISAPSWQTSPYKITNTFQLSLTLIRECQSSLTTFSMTLEKKLLLISAIGCLHSKPLIFTHLLIILRPASIATS